MSAEDVFGADLRLLGDLQSAEQRRRGADLLVAPRPASGRDDLRRAVGVENLQQALLLRFLTERGELAHLGHPEYGSRLHELVGELNTDTTRNRAKLFALQALADEARIARVVSVDVRTTPGVPSSIDVVAVLQAVDDPDPVRVTVPVDLAGGAR